MNCIPAAPPSGAILLIWKAAGFCAAHTARGAHGGKRARFSASSARKRKHRFQSIIARKALELIEDGQTIFMDASSTVCRLAEKLSGFQRLRVITNGLKTAGILAEKDGVEVYCTGGRLRGNAKSFVGLPAVSFVEKFHADTAFFSCRGVSEEAGVTDASEEEADLKRTYLRHARRGVLLADCSKLSLQYFCRICALDEIDTLVSDIPLSPPYVLPSAPETATK